MKLNNLSKFTQPRSVMWLHNTLLKLLGTVLKCDRLRLNYSGLDLKKKKTLGWSI